MEPLVLQVKMREFIVELHPILLRFPKGEKFAIVQEIKQACYRSLKYIVLAHNTPAVNKERKYNLFREVDGEIKLLQELIAICYALDFIRSDAIKLKLEQRLNEMGRMVGGLLKANKVN